MAVPKKRTSRSKRDMRRRQNSKWKLLNISVEQSSGELHMRHRVSPLGYYRGKKVIAID